MSKRRAAFLTLGCKVNQYETDAMEEILEKAGYEIVSFKETADVYIINTCSVTNMADRKSRQMIHRAKKNNPDAIIVAAGCYVQAAEEELAKKNEADILVGNNKKKDIAQILEEYFAAKEVFNITKKEQKGLVKQARKITWIYSGFRILLILLAVIEPFLFMEVKDLILLAGYFVIWFALAYGVLQFRVYERRKMIKNLKAF